MKTHGEQLQFLLLEFVELIFLLPVSAERSFGCYQVVLGRTAKIFYSDSDTLTCRKLPRKKLQLQNAEEDRQRMMNGLQMIGLFTLDSL